MRSYPSKIILFGEHSLLYGSEGLAIPGTKYCGRWKQGAGQHFGTDLFRLADYLTIHKDQFHNSIDVAAFLNDVENGWFFDSNIPVGYGAGSSGAYSAAIYDRYATIVLNRTEQLKSDLALIESYFHGKSSGIDPLVSFSNRPFQLINGHFNSVEVCEENISRFHLVDTRIPRQGAAYIEMFKNKMKEKVFADKIHDTLIPAVSKAISATLGDNTEALRSAFFEISYFQLVWMPEFIPVTWIRNWEHRLSDPDGYFKLCGAGGGGFLLEYK